MHAHLKATLTGILVLLIAIPAQSESQEKQLIVGTHEVPPFVVRQPDGALIGLSIRLWEDLAEELGLRYILREMELHEQFAALEAGELDVAVGALTVTANREARIDFTHPFHSSGLGIAVPHSPSGAWTTVEAVLSWRFLQLVGTLTITLVAIGAMVWFFERRANPEQFGGGVVRGLGSGFWWSAVTMTTVGYGDKAPKTPGGRVVALIWMFVSIVAISGFTAAVASSLTVGQLRTKVQGPEDLPEVVVGTIAHSTSEAYLKSQGLTGRLYENAEQALSAMTAGEVDAVVYDAPILQYLVRSIVDSRARVLPNILQNQDYAIGLPSKSSLREPLNRALLAHRSTPVWRELLKRYLGQ